MLFSSKTGFFHHISALLLPLPSLVLPYFHRPCGPCIGKQFPSGTRAFGPCFALLFRNRCALLRIALAALAAFGSPSGARLCLPAGSFLHRPMRALLPRHRLAALRLAPELGRSYGATFGGSRPELISTQEVYPSSINLIVKFYPLNSFCLKASGTSLILETFFQISCVC